jgi:hypothetical protein
MTGRTDLVNQLTAERTSAGAARTEAVTAASGIVNKIFDTAAGVLKTQKELQTAESAAAEAKTTKATTDAKAAQTAGIAALSSNAASYIGLAGSKGDPVAAKAVSDAIVKGLFPTTLPAMSDLAPLYDKYKVLAADDAATQQGKNAFLASLGLAP